MCWPGLSRFRSEISPSRNQLQPPFYSNTLPLNSRAIPDSSVGIADA